MRQNKIKPISVTSQKGLALLNPEGLPAWVRVRPILETLNREGFLAYVVGGAVRDLLLGIQPADMDILTNAGPEDLKEIFQDQDVRYVGKSFAVTLVNGVEVASCRSEDRMAGGQDPAALAGFPADDLGMRDVTINAMAADLFSGDLIDPFGGRADLEERIIRFTGSADDRIHEDSLRMIRACRFAARYSAGLDPRAFAAVSRHKKMILTHTAAERVQAELLKAMAMERPSIFFHLLQDTGLLALILPCLDRCHGLDGGPHHGETVFDHCMLVGDALGADRPVFRLAGYLHDVGKYDAARMKEGKLTFAGHEKHEEALVRDLSNLKFSNRDKAYILSLIRAHMRPLNDESTPKAVRRLLAMLDDLNLDYRDFLRLRIADKKSNLAKAPYTLTQLKTRLGKLLNEMSGRAAFNINDLDISGSDICRLLNIPPGPEVGEVKKYLFEQVLADPALNDRNTLLSLVKKSIPYEDV